MSGEKYVTMSAIRPILKHLEERVLVDGDADTSLTCDIRRRIMVSLTRHYKVAKVNELLDMALSLDPRFKLDFTPEQDVANMRTRLQEEAEVMLDEDMLKAVWNKVRKTHIFQRKSLHLQKRESLGNFCSRTRMFNLLKQGY